MKRTNAGYKIIMSIKLPNEEYVLGEKVKPSGNEYVTWCCVNKNHYHYGHYFYSKRVAIKDLYERTQKEINRRLDDIKEQLYAKI